MIEQILLRYLTKKGKIIYFIGLAVVFGVVIYVDWRASNLRGYTLGGMFILKLIIANLVWGLICYYAWRKPKEEMQNPKSKKKR